MSWNDKKVYSKYSFPLPYNRNGTVSAGGTHEDKKVYSKDKQHVRQTVAHEKRADIIVWKSIGHLVNPFHDFQLYFDFLNDTRT